jgi:hypothetical protein
VVCPTVIWASRRWDGAPSSPSSSFCASGAGILREPVLSPAASLLLPAQAATGRATKTAANTTSSRGKQSRGDDDARAMACGSRLLFFLLVGPWSPQRFT